MENVQTGSSRLTISRRKLNSQFWQCILLLIRFNPCLKKQIKEAVVFWSLFERKMAKWSIKLSSVFDKQANKENQILEQCKRYFEIFQIHDFFSIIWNCSICSGSKTGIGHQPVSGWLLCSDLPMIHWSPGTKSWSIEFLLVLVSTDTSDTGTSHCHCNNYCN